MPTASSSVSLRLAAALAAVFCAVVLAAPPAARAQFPVGVRVVASDTLHDVAVAATEQGVPTIYYSPELLTHVRPALAQFFLAHEYGHLMRGHTGGALRAGDARFAERRRAQELEADCYAAARLGSATATAAEQAAAVIQFFSRMAEFRFDDLHPTGADRAARVASCLSGGAGGVAPGSLPAPVTFSLRAPQEQLPTYGYDARVWLDGVPLGELSNMRLADARLTVRGFAAGPHEYEVTMRVYALGPGLQLIPVGSVRGVGMITVAEGDVLTVSWERNNAIGVGRERGARPR